MEDFLNQLNESQRAAVEYIDGSSLVIAGAGSGKTRVLTCKIAYLLGKGIPPQTILALTFTNKAAKEMKERIATLVGFPTAQRLWMGTFHSVFSRILRNEANHIGYPSNFTIYDTTDSKSLLRAITKEMGLDEKVYKPGMVQSRISHAKNALITARMYDGNRELTEYDEKSKVPALRDIYTRYQQRCFQAGAMDFDDLLLMANILFRDHPAVLDKYRSFFQYILVDEYQDTNFAQHLIIQQLSEQHGRICVVGDDAQSIYSFRGANINNILKFQNIYPGCRVFKLEQNYRSTQNIVNAANSLIHKNQEQIHKTVFSEKEKGSKVTVYSSYSDYEEAYAIAGKIVEMRTRKSYRHEDFAILYRTNAQSRIIEEALRKRSVPYKIYGGLSFYQRKEIKDIISYFRLLINPSDEEAFKRVINYPARGIGNTTLAKLSEASRQHGQSLWVVIQEPLEYGVNINAGTAGKLRSFRELIFSFLERNRTLPADEMAVAVLQESGIVGMLMSDCSVEGISKQENLQELMNGIAGFVEMRREEGEERITLADFMSEVALLTDQDNDKEENTDKVTLMTIHAAKGLEFRNVFVAGMEENLFPSQMSTDSMRAVEEERRLFYVALTRAEENCFLTYAKSRFRNGQTQMSAESRFLHDIDEEYLDLPSGFGRERRQAERMPAFESPFRQPVPAGGVSPGERFNKPDAAAGKPASSAEAIPAGGYGNLQVGSRILHDRFGEGTVIALEDSGSDTKAVVEFSHSGQKKLLLKFAKLTILE